MPTIHVDIVSAEGEIHSGEAAMVFANFLMSPEAQLEKSKPEIWGDPTVLNVSKLPAADQSKFKQLISIYSVFLL